MSQEKILKLALPPDKIQSAQNNADSLCCPVSLEIPSDPVLAVYPLDPRVQIFSKTALKRASKCSPILNFNDAVNIEAALEAVSILKKESFIRRYPKFYQHKSLQNKLNRKLKRLHDVLSPLLKQIYCGLESDEERITFIKILKKEGKIPEKIQSRPEIPKLITLLDSLKTIKKFPYFALAYCLQLRLCSAKKMPIHWADTRHSEAKAQNFLQLAILLLNITGIDTQDKEVQRFLLAKENSGYLIKANQTLGQYKHNPRSFHFTDKEQLFLNQMGMQELISLLSQGRNRRLPTEYLSPINATEQPERESKSDTVVSTTLLKPAPIKSRFWKENNSDIANAIHVLKSYNKICFFNRHHVRDVNDVIQELMNLKSQDKLKKIERKELEQKLSQLFERVKNKTNYNSKGELVDKLKIIAVNADLSLIFDPIKPSYTPR